MTIVNQRTIVSRIAKELQAVADAAVFDWKRAKRLRDELGEALRTDAQRAKRERYNDRRRSRDARADMRDIVERAVSATPPAYVSVLQQPHNCRCQGRGCALCR